MSNTTRFIILPKDIEVEHEPACFFWDKNTSTAFQSVKAEFSENKSWITQTNVYSDGSYYMLTAVDLVFLLISLFEYNSSMKNNRYSFIELDSIPLSQNYQDAGISSDLRFFLNQAIIKDKARILCEVQDVGSDSVYSLNEEKTIQFLRSKIEKLAQNIDKIPEIHNKLKKKSAQLSSKPEMLQGLRMCEAGEIISNYLPVRWKKLLFEKLELDIIQSNITNFCKSQDQLNSIKLSDYVNSSNSSNDRKEDVLKATKMAKIPKSAQSITNFFKKA
ncbi:hypothetical protein BB561_001015 [Smittium simulii]|uniref:Ribonuclease H2 subunit B wHTH domain-containing protein n=1 Tax=Smittium simulii TaxID=133385 RepID=A0A2T9YWI8_9FUNG|nr:hypothetical protein BB561_001015 [Smittium simulii]